MEWDDDVEKLLEQLADESMVSYRLHKKLYEYYSYWNKFFSLPIIIFSSICSSGNFLSQSFPSIEKNLIVSVGGLSMITAIIGSVSSYLKFAEKSSTHLVVYNS